jgi:hypothetical protein
MQFKDRLADLLAASAARRSIDPPSWPSVELISLGTLTEQNIPSIRRFQQAVSKELDFELHFVGGGYGCTRLFVVVAADSPAEAARLLAEMLRNETVADAAVTAGFSIMKSDEPFYFRRNLKTGKTEGVLPNDGLLLFCSYSHKDEKHRENFGEHLSNLVRQGLIREWHDRMLSGGVEWAKEIDSKLESAKIFVFLVSASFNASNYCNEIEGKRALQRHDEGSARVVPVLVRPVDYEGAPFAKLQMAPKDALAVTLWENEDLAWRDVARTIRNVVREIRQS